MEITLNGQKVSTQAATLAELLREKRLPETGVAVAVGSRVVRREAWEATPLEEGTAITVIRATQGG